MSRVRRWGLTLPLHWHVFASFFLYSFGFGGFFPRLAEIQHQMGVGEGALGLALAGTATGTLVSLTFAGPWVDRIGSRAILLVLLPTVPSFFALASFAPSPAWLFVSLLPAGVCIGVVEIVCNLEADRMEHASGWRLMNRSHAFWSFGFAGGSLLGAGMSWLGVGVHLHLLSMVPLTLLGTVLLLGRFDATPHRSGDLGAQPDATRQPKRLFALPSAAIVLLVLVTLPSMLLEGAGADWSAIYMRNIFQSPPALGALAVTAGALSQALARYWVDPFVERYSPVVVGRVMLGLLGLGDVLVFSALSPALSLLGFAVMGLGTSALFPLAMSAAAQRTDRPAAHNVAALAQTAFVAFLAAPPLLGWVAQSFGIRWSFGCVMPLILLSMGLATVLQIPQPALKKQPQM